MRLRLFLAGLGLAAGLGDLQAFPRRHARGGCQVHASYQYQESGRYSACGVAACGGTRVGTPCPGQCPGPCPVGCVPMAPPAAPCPAVGVALPTGPAAGPVQGMVPQEGGGFTTLLLLHNQERARAGLPPLVLDPGLCAEAAVAARAQAGRRACGHFTAILSGSENAAQGQTTEWEAHSSWMHSSGHRANVLGRWQAVGFGMAWGAGGPYWAARFR